MVGKLPTWRSRPGRQPNRFKAVAKWVDSLPVSGETEAGPTRGAFEQADDQRWRSSPSLATALRVVVFVAPIAGAFLGLFLVADVLYRPPGTVGVAVWFVQSVLVSSLLSVAIERLARRLLPLASLFSLSLLFPDQAPSRFGTALRAGSLKQLRARIQEEGEGALGRDVGAAATRAVEFVTALGRHDRLTRGHTERVRAYADLIATQMGLSNTDREKLAWGVMLHDIGKIAVPEEVLNKREKLTDEEWQILRAHPEAGERLLTPLRAWLGPWALAASEHHERWDGRGYPRGLAGTEISLAGRITAVADAYDVITSRRSYKEPMSTAAARRELVVCAGTQFDPDVVRALLNVSVGRRWSAGLLAAVSHLPAGNLGAAPAAMVFGVVAAVGSAVAGLVPPDVVGALAYAPVEVEAPASTTSVPVASEPAAIVPPPEVEPSTSEVAPEPPPLVGESSTTTSSSSTTTTTATTAPPTTTTTTSPTTAPTTAPTTTTTTTTAPPTTTTTTAPPTTTTTTAPASVYYLKNDGTGDTSAVLFKDLELAGPDNGSLPNYDTNRDSIPGLRLQSTTNGWGESDNARIQRYYLNPNGGTLSGSVVLRAWAATDQNGASATLHAALSDCDNWGFNCTDLGVAQATVNTWQSTGFQELTYDFGSQSHTFGAGRRLVVRLMTQDSETLHTGFDATPYPSRIDLPLS